MRKPPRATSATALVTTSPLVPVTASFLCWGAGVGVAEGVGSSYRSITGVGSGGLRVGVVLGLGLGVTDGVADGVGADGVGLGADGLGSGVVDGLGSGVGVGSGVGAGVGVLSNPALPPDSRRTTRVLTSQDLSWEVIDAVSVHGPGSVALTLMFSSTRAFSPALRVALSVALSLVQLVMPGSMKRSY
jgi:hypothetical protein